MTSRFVKIFILTILLSLGIVSLSQADDRIYYRNKDGKVIDTVGKIKEESINGVRFSPNVGKEINVLADDIVRLVYEIPSSLRLELNPIFASEDRGDFKGAYEAIKPFEKKFKANSSVTKMATRGLEFSIAKLKAETQQPEAKTAMIDFIRKYPANWQSWVLARQLTTMQAKDNDIANAIKIWSQLSATNNILPAMKQIAELQIVDLMLQSKMFTEAKAKIDTLIKGMPSTDLNRKKLEIYLILCKAKDEKIENLVKEIQTVIDRNLDNRLRAVAYNILGDCYDLKGLKRDAMWQYLTVETVYNQDKEERLKSLNRLAKLFESDFHDSDRAKQFREKANKLH